MNVNTLFVSFFWSVLINTCMLILTKDKALDIAWPAPLHFLGAFLYMPLAVSVLRERIQTSDRIIRSILPEFLLSVLFPWVCFIIPKAPKQQLTALWLIAFICVVLGAAYDIQFTWMLFVGTYVTMIPVCWIFISKRMHYEELKLI